ncbi:Crp/Fnr family transcriptional regulator [Blastochloris viridis]|uniref:Anaerobic aromatic degradation regulator n=1 Tax=Blastochloris viridis TaxID=1079 RepID=A0A0H5BA74_BLAVI|nr:Crp/Fnr family transcriptional regulator [Blastochloris viridis]ALK10933.1 Nitrogen fixation regulation protein FixK [Blastochloris viridis]BAR99085.1 nitric oxide -responding transcriptional regulator NnrR [Blastochloris viridis]CUU43595.1 Anaerobic aromatic degradation regulator [Blastochloris viridis]
MASLDRTLIANLPLFSGLKPEELDALLSEAQSVRYPKGVTVFHQDAEARAFFVLLHGHLRVFKLTPDGQQVVVRFVVPGEVFGVAMAIGRTVYPGTAVAVADSIALQWPSAAWPRLAAAHPELANNTLQTVGARLQDMHTRVVEMATLEVERRIAHALLRLAQQAGRKVETGVTIDFPISRQDVAEMTGTTLHTVSRILSAWEARGLVESARQKITLRQPHQLMLLAEGTG